MSSRTTNALLTVNAALLALNLLQAAGGGSLRLRSGGGEVRVKLGATASGAGLVLMDAATNPAIQLSAAPAATTVTLAEKGKPSRILAP